MNINKVRALRLLLWDYNSESMLATNTAFVPI